MSRPLARSALWLLFSLGGCVHQPELSAARSCSAYQDTVTLVERLPGLPTLPQGVVPGLAANRPWAPPKGKELLTFRSRRYIPFGWPVRVSAVQGAEPSARIVRIGEVEGVPVYAGQHVLQEDSPEWILLPLSSPCVLQGFWSERGVVRPEAPGAYSAPAADTAPEAIRWRDGELLAYGLEPLRLMASPAGHRELRLRPSSGPGSIPRLFVRVVDRAGTGATAEWVAFWPTRLWVGADEQQRHAFRRRMRRERRCGPIRRLGETEFCHLAVVTGSQAAALVAWLDSVGAWPLPDPQHPPTLPGRIHIQLDGRSVAAEAREGTAYRARHFGQRDMRTDSAVAFLYRFAYSLGTPLPTGVRTRTRE